MNVMPIVLLVAAAAGLGACDDGTRTTPAGAPDTAVADTIDAAADHRSVAARAAEPAVAAWLERVDSAVFTRWGACPFECCVYRDWIAEAPVVVRAEPANDAAASTTVPAGQRFLADTGFVRITSAQLVVLTEPVTVYVHPADPRDGGDSRPMQAGDTLLVLEHLGEGQVMLTDGRALVSADQFWAEADGWEPYGGAKARTLGTHAAEWWAHVRTRDGVEGWIDAYGSELGNVDACGM